MKNSIAFLIMFGLAACGRGVDQSEVKSISAGTMSDPALTSDESKEIFTSLSSDSPTPSVGGGLVLKRVGEVSCSSTTIAAPNQSPTTSFNCGQLTPGTSKSLFQFLPGPAVGSGGGGGLVMMKHGRLECMYSETSSPAPADGRNTPNKMYFCRNLKK